MGKLATTGYDTEKAFNAIVNEVYALHCGWSAFAQFFAHSPERVNLLNEVMPDLLGWLHEILIRNVFIRISRLTDPAASKHGESLVLRRAVSDLSLPNSHPSRREVAQMLRDLDRAVKDIRVHRNKLVAHIDLRARLDQKMLPNVTGLTVEDAITRITRVVYRVSVARGGSSIRFDKMVTDDDGSTLHALLLLGMEKKNADLSAMVQTKVAVQRQKQ